MNAICTAIPADMSGRWTKRKQARLAHAAERRLRRSLFWVRRVIFVRSVKNEINKTSEIACRKIKFVIKLLGWQKPEKLAVAMHVVVFRVVRRCKLRLRCSISECSINHSRLSTARFPENGGVFWELSFRSPSQKSFRYSLCCIIFKSSEMDGYKPLFR
jgi:hypothetical protein